MATKPTPDTSITTLDDAPKAVEPKPTRKLAGADPELSGARVELTIHQGSGEDGRTPVYVGLNGTGYQIPRGVAVNVPVEVLEILDNAVQTVFETNGAVATPRQVKRYGYNVRQLAAA